MDAHDEMHSNSGTMLRDIRLDQYTRYHVRLGLDHSDSIDGVAFDRLKFKANRLVMLRLLTE